MTEQEYRSHPAVSRSELFRMSESPEKFRYFKDHPVQPTPALVFGQAFHKMALQPEDFYTEFAVIPNLDRRTKDGKAEYQAFLNENGEKTLITGDDFAKIQAMCTALNEAHSVTEHGNVYYARKLLSGQKEVPFFWTDEMTGEECKCRVDCLSSVKDLNLIVDLKTAAKADMESFTRDIVKYGYDLQTAMYAEGVKANTGVACGFVFIVIEKEEPYSVNICQADPLIMKRGYDLFREYMGIYHDCRQTGNWYGYLGKYGMINNVSLPAWLAKEYE